MAKIFNARNIAINVCFAVFWLHRNHSLSNLENDSIQVVTNNIILSLHKFYYEVYSKYDDNIHQDEKWNEMCRIILNGEDGK